MFSQPRVSVLCILQSLRKGTHFIQFSVSRLCHQTRCLHLGKQTKVPQALIDRMDSLRSAELVPLINTHWLQQGVGHGF